METSPPVRLALELEIYEANKPIWLHDHAGEFVLIHDRDEPRFFTEFHEAYRAGIERYAINTNFLIKKVVAQESLIASF